MPSTDRTVEEDFLVVVFIVVIGLEIVSNVILLLFTMLVMTVDVDPALV